jgi:F-type H+-transporting ATPase subunit a
MIIAAIIAADQPPGTHPVIQICSGSGFLCVFNYDTLISSGIAIVLTLALGLGVSYRLTHGTPGKLQSVLELLLSYVRNLTREMVSDEGTDFILPIAATIFIFVLLANWLDFFPLTAPVEPAAADINLTLAMAIVVIVIVQWYSIHVLGFRGYLRRFTKPFELPLIARVAFTPLNIIEEIQKPLSLGLRLFGNIFGGLVMVYLLTLGYTAFAGSSVIQTALSPIWVILLVAWKLFDVFLIGTIQAFIFMLLTIIYFGMAREGLEEHHGAASHANDLRRETT